MSIEFTPVAIDAPAEPANEYDEAVTVVKSAATGWAGVLVPADKVRAVKRGLTKAAKVQHVTLRYREVKTPTEGTIQLAFSVRPAKAEAPAKTPAA